MCAVGSLSAVPNEELGANQEDRRLPCTGAPLNSHGEDEDTLAAVRDVRMNSHCGAEEWGEVGAVLSDMVPGWRSSGNRISYEHSKMAVVVPCTPGRVGN